jgi:predicted permease
MESAVLAMAGGLLGIGLGYSGMRLLERLVPQGLPESSLALDARVLSFGIAATLATVLLFGLLPALKSTGAGLHDALKQGGRGGIGGAGRWVRNALVSGEVALAMVLLVSAGLMIRTLHNMRSAPAGFRTEHLLTLRLALPVLSYPDAEKRAMFYQNLLDRIQVLPGVRSAAFAGNLPFTTIGNTFSYLIDGRPAPPPGNVQDALYRPVTREYFSTIGASLKEGRTFTAEDRATAPPVAVINEHMARLHWGDASPLGLRIRLGGRDIPCTVIGVVKDLNERGVLQPQKAGVYVLMEQGNSGPGAFLAVRTASDPMAMARSVSNAVWSLDRNMPMSMVRTMEMIVERQLQGRSLQMNLLLAFAALAVTLASLGIYGVLSYLVTQQTREIGVHMALGATTRQVARKFVARGAALTAIGVTLGAVIALLLARSMQSMLFGVAPTDPAVYLGVAAVLSTVAMVACYLPARRASRVDPMAALRVE